MVKKVTNRLSLLLGASLILLLCAVAFFPIKAKAAMADEAYDYYFGETYEGNTGYYASKYYKFTLTKKSNVYISFKIHYEEISSLNLYNGNGKKVIEFNDFVGSYNQATGIATYTCTRVLPAGTYYQEIYASLDDQHTQYSYFATAEPAITLARPEITSLTNSGKQTFTVKYGAVKYRTGYQIQYATNSKFSGAKKSNTGATSKSVGKLTKNKTYYVRVRAYSLYGAGNLVYSPWSVVQTVKIKK